MTSESDREALASFVAGLDWIPGTPVEPKAGAYVVADAILAAGFGRPRVVETAEELEALPTGSVVMSGGDIYRRRDVNTTGLFECLDDFTYDGFGHESCDAHTVFWRGYDSHNDKPTATVLFVGGDGE